MNLQSEYHGKNSYPEKKLLSWPIVLEQILHHCMLGQNILSPGVWEKNCYRNQGYIPFDQSKSGFCDPKFDFSFH